MKSYEMKEILTDDETINSLLSQINTELECQLTRDQIMDVVNNWNIVCESYSKGKTIDVEAEKKRLHKIIKGLKAGLEALKITDQYKVHQHNLIFKKSEYTKPAIYMVEKELKRAMHTKEFMLSKNNISLDHDRMLAWGLNVLFSQAEELGFTFPGESLGPNYPNKVVKFIIIFTGLDKKKINHAATKFKRWRSSEKACKYFGDPTCFDAS